MDVGVWLRSLGLGQYEATFRDNEIDGAVLPKLTVDDLKDLGVAVVGHRRKIMSAIEELNATSVARADAMKPPQTQAPPSVRGQPRWSRAPSDHGHVLRSCRFDEPSREARRRGLAQPRQRLSRRGFGRGDRAWRPCAEEARRRADGPVRLSARAGERRRARRARRARDPARAFRPQCQERADGRAGAFRPHRP